MQDVKYEYFSHTVNEICDFIGVDIPIIDYSRRMNRSLTARQQNIMRNINKLPFTTVKYNKRIVKKVIQSIF